MEAWEADFKLIYLNWGFADPRLFQTRSHRRFMTLITETQVGKTTGILPVLFVEGYSVKGLFVP